MTVIDRPVNAKKYPGAHSRGLHYSILPVKCSFSMFILPEAAKGHRMAIRLRKNSDTKVTQFCTEFAEFYTRQNLVSLLVAIIGKKSFLAKSLK